MNLVMNIVINLKKKDCFLVILIILVTLFISFRPMQIY